MAVEDPEAARRFVEPKFGRQLGPASVPNSVQNAAKIQFQCAVFKFSNAVSYSQPASQPATD